MVFDLGIEPTPHGTPQVYMIVDHEASRRGYRNVKIGFSVQPTRRLSALQVGNPRKLEIAATWPGTEDDEKALHWGLTHLGYHIHYEWFEIPETVYRTLVGYHDLNNLFQLIREKKSIIDQHRTRLINMLGAK